MHAFLWVFSFDILVIYMYMYCTCKALVMYACTCICVDERMYNSCQKSCCIVLNSEMETGMPKIVLAFAHRP